MPPRPPLPAMVSKSQMVAIQSMVSLVQRELRQQADPKKATAMQAYLKTTMPM